MPDPFRHVRPGEPLNFSATAYNAFVDAALAHRARQLDRGANALDSFRQADIVRVLNNTELDLARFSVLGLDGPIFRPSESLDAFQREVTFSGVLPTAGHRGRFAILLEPALSGRVARAYVAGVCIVSIDVQDDDDTFADVTDGETAFLTSGTSGAARILWREGEDAYGGGYDEGYGYTGEQWAIVRIGATADEAADQNRFVRVTGGDIEPGATGEVTVYANAEGSSLTGTTMMVKNQWQTTTIPDGVDIWIHRHGGQWGFGVFECVEGYY